MDWGESSFYSDDMSDIGDTFADFVPEAAERSQHDWDPGVQDGEGFVAEFENEGFDSIDFLEAAAIGGAIGGMASTPGESVAGLASKGTHGPVAGGPSIYRGRGAQVPLGKQVGGAFPSREIEGEFDVGFEVEHLQAVVDMLNTKLRELEEIQARGEVPKKFAWAFKVQLKHNPRYNGKGPTHHAFLSDVGAIKTVPSAQRPTTSILAAALSKPAERGVGVPPNIMAPTREPLPPPPSAPKTSAAVAEMVKPPIKVPPTKLWRAE